MKNKYLRFFNGILAIAITILGFSCEDTPDMYGMPPVNYTVKGKVVNQQNESVPDIQLIIKDAKSDYKTPGDTIKSIDNGIFWYQKYGDNSAEKIKIIYRDLRDKETVYQTDSIIVDKVDSEDITIELEEKEKSE